MTTPYRESNLGVNQILTNIAQRYVQPEHVMRLLYPLVEVGSISGQILSFGDEDYNNVNDDVADGDNYAEIEDTFSGQPFVLNSKGLMYKLPDRKRRQLEFQGYNWGQHAATKLMERASLLHEAESATKATNAANYATDNKITLTSGSQFNEATVDPEPVIRQASTAIIQQIGVKPNVMILGRNVFDALATKFSKTFTSTVVGGMRQQLTEDVLAATYGFARVRVCDAIVKNGQTKTNPFGKNIVIARVNPAALNADRIPYRIDGSIMPQEYSFGYTYVYKGNPLMYDRGRNDEKNYDYFKLDFDRSVVHTGVNKTSGLIESGYLIKDAVA
ncbi:major capsid protein [Nodularia phage vB_NpeS-2AV2]|uniref:Major capsid protein n=1 Tax=Nodularia phage vB_NpeS-2AV2 TaxID=1777122 RepID=A0A1L2BWR1_9CAUD|nr:major head protein [Nodularia phage vB_NpeS-2AV2]ALY07482.1 major capsid protein [Nodularia phage vB_NpeS-2AV2]